MEAEARKFPEAGKLGENERPANRFTCVLARPFSTNDRGGIYSTTLQFWKEID